MLSDLNRFVEKILRSPFHGLLSGNTMLITVIGRKSGRQITLPCNYWRTDGALLVISRKGRKWWTNVRGGAPVTVLLKRRVRRGFAEVLAEDDGTVARELMSRRGFPKERSERLAKKRLLVLVRLRDGAD